MLTVPNNHVIINLKVISCFFGGEVQWFGQGHGPGEFAAGFLCGSPVIMEVKQMP